MPKQITAPEYGYVEEVEIGNVLDVLGSTADRCASRVNVQILIQLNSSGKSR